MTADFLTDGPSQTVASAPGPVAGALVERGPAQTDVVDGDAEFVEAADDDRELVGAAVRADGDA